MFVCFCIVISVHLNLSSKFHYFAVSLLTYTHQFKTHDEELLQLTYWKCFNSIILLMQVQTFNGLVPVSENVTKICRLCLMQ